VVVVEALGSVKAFVLDSGSRGGVWVGVFLARDQARLGDLGDWLVKFMSDFFR
jgi:hypothetical protein